RQMPENARAWHNIAVAHQALGQLSAARDAWDHVINLDPTNIEAYARRAEVYMDFDDWPAAVRDLSQAYAIEPRDVDIKLNLALALMKLGQHAEAGRLVEGILVNQPRNVPALNRLGEIHWSAYVADSTAAERAAAVDAWQRSLAIDAAQADVRAALDVARDARE
ncbi:MAG: tetratricopeptide repeat protein, partial [Phycisphaerae bacterium]|nr:tetratricopeptide repeat protein [Phycisphaerae bacterium]